MRLSTSQYNKKTTLIPNEENISIVVSNYGSPTARLHKILWGAFLFMALSWLLFSCKGSTSEQPVNTADTAGLAAFKAQKLNDSLQNLSENGQNEPKSNGVQARKADQSGSDREYTSDNQNDGDAPSDNSEVANTNDNSADNSSSNEDVSHQTANTDNGDQTATAEPVKKKKKFSSASKGALIGAGSGAVLGAVVSKKNRGLGAVIGAAVGGGAGYGIGKHKDNKDAQKED